MTRTVECWRCEQTVEVLEVFTTCDCFIRIGYPVTPSAMAPVATPRAHAATAPTGEQAIAGLSPCEGRNAA